jgi:hypothetical protein
MRGKWQIVVTEELNIINVEKMREIEKSQLKKQCSNSCSQLINGKN